LKNKLHILETLHPNFQRFCPNFVFWPPASVGNDLNQPFINHDLKYFVTYDFDLNQSAGDLGF